MKRRAGMEFIGLSVVVLVVFALSHVLVANVFMLTLALPYLYINESVLGHLMSLGVNGYVAIVLSVTAGIIGYVAAVGLLGYAFVRFPSIRKKSTRP
jgi:hypothetical protein